MTVCKSHFALRPIAFALMAVLGTPAVAQTVQLEDRLRAEIEQMRSDEARLEMQLELARELNASRNRLDSMRQEILQNLGGQAAPAGYGYPQPSYAPPAGYGAPAAQGYGYPAAAGGTAPAGGAYYTPGHEPYQAPAARAPTHGGYAPAAGMAPLFPNSGAAPAQGQAAWQPAAGAPRPAREPISTPRRIDRIPEPIAREDDSQALERRIRDLEAELSAQLSGALGVRTRTGTEGLSTLNEVVGTVGGSMPLGDLGEVWVEATQVDLDTQSRPSDEDAQLVGSAPLFPATVPPTVTSASGTGIRIGFERPDFGLSAGLTPRGFLVENFVGNIFWRPLGGPFQLELDRSPMRDTLLSYAGSRDFFTRQVFGGVVTNTARLSASFGDPDATQFYGSAAYSTFEGENVASNSGYSLNAGVLWPLGNRWNEDLTVGFDFLAMGHDKNLSQFTLGHGGYFSPKHFFRPSVTLAWDGQIGDTTRWSLLGRLGYQTFRVNAAPFFPNDPQLQTESGQFHDAESVSGTAYALRGNIAHRLTPHWTTGGWLGIDNSRDFENIVFGLYATYYFSRQDRTPLMLDSRWQNPQ